MPDPRRHVSPGQKLSLAAAQVNWINEQMRRPVATDVQAGDVTFPGTVVAVCSLSSTIDNVLPGHVVRLTGSASHVLPGTGEVDSKRTARAFALSGEVVIPCSFDNYDDSSRHLGVIVGGSTMPQDGDTTMVRVAIAGMCIARVHWFGAGSYIRGPVLRVENEDPDTWTGYAEQSSCGPHRLLSPLGAIDDDAERQWCVVLL